MSSLIADGHVHLYPGYDVGAALRCLHDRLRAAVPPGRTATLAGFLTEGAASHRFRELRQAGTIAGGVWRADPGPEDAVLLLRDAAGAQLLLQRQRALQDSAGTRRGPAEAFRFRHDSVPFR